MNYYQSKEMQLLCNEKYTAAMMKKYHTDGSDLTDDHPFVQEFLLPLLQKISDDITGISDPNSPQHTKVSIFVINADEKNESSHDYRRYKTHLCYDKTLPIPHLVSSLRHETEHALQTLGIGYSTDERKLVALARIKYATSGPPYKNNYVELRARLEQTRIQVERYEMCEKQPGDHFQEKQNIAAQLLTFRSQMLEDISQDVIDEWRNDFADKVSRFFYRNKELLEIFPEARTMAEAKKQAEDFLLHTSEDIFKDCLARIEALKNKIDEIVEEVDKEAVKHEKEEVFTLFTQIGKELGIPVLETPPVEFASQLYPLNKGSAEFWVRDHYQQYHNVAIVMHPEHGPCLMYDRDAVYRAYMHPEKATSAQQQDEKPEKETHATEQPQQDTPEFDDDERFGS